ncbi:nicotinate phosphoribosyltransferase [Paracholeplasma manati]|uniref:Nicotinate phosphoribosyltransferase n=1 Tax=Paracholeplasma manati TaxID=591373 RepID=A0ABT2Y765_9MOLU|nr:nicotinate phosphoribosyltransferase [Paracholeplasma manati]MCV2232584.1 nicotinate phosphoribosyltransferase [Paracholeplasma manati]MDG0889077.1 nicotinate phosphoribosyltransferase [Paracholeplasma manati]MDX9807160.1 nicotinate phosphoribosyltransferase [Acholeplasma sp.]
MRNLSMLIDFYELTMANSYFEHNKNEEAVFDLFFRSVPDEGGYAVMAGLEQAIQYIQELSFTQKDIDYLRGRNLFSEGFLNYLKDFKFTSSVYAIKEGTPIFPNEPVLTVQGPIIECQLIETMLLLTINHQSLIATKTARIVAAAKGRAVLEFGSRRAQGYDAATFGARAAYIAGAVGSSNTITDRDFQIPAIGTMAHAYVQSFDSEYDAFLAYAKTYPKDSVFLVDTYSTLGSGVPNAIKVYQDYLKPNGYTLKGIRIDSGDLTYLSKKSRELLDAAGLTNTKITVSNSLDEYLIRELVEQGAQIDAFGVGERLITSKSDSVFGGVYKLSALKENGQWVPKMKLSDNVVKTTNPGVKKLFRLFDKTTNNAIADVVTLDHETIDDTKPFLLFDPNFPWKQKQVKNFRVESLLEPIFIQGKLVYKKPLLKDIRAFHQAQMATLWDEVKRFENPHPYYVDLSQDLWKLKQQLIEQYSKKA